MSKESTRLALLIGACAAMYFTALGTARLWDVDEAIFAQAAAEMHAQGEWIVPSFNGQLFPDKPPFLYWVMRAAYALFGTNEFAARVGSAIFGTATTLLTYAIGKRLFTRTVAFWSALIFASSLNVVIIARAATPDALLTFFCTLALYGFVRATALALPKDADESYSPLPEEEVARPRRLAWLGIYAAMAAAVLVKGPIGIVLPTASLGLYLLLSHPRAEASGWWQGVRATFDPRLIVRTIWEMRPLTALIMLIAVAGPWYAAVGMRTGGEWLQGFLGVHNLGRFMNPMDNHSGPIFYYLLAILIGLFPWSIFTLPTLRLTLHRVRAHHPWRNGILLMMAWSAVWIGFFSIASTKLPSYVLPAYPALALLLGSMVGTWVEQPSSLSIGWQRAALGTLAGVGLLLVIATPLIAQRFLGPDAFLGVFGLAPLVAAVIALILSEQQQIRAAAATLGYGAVALAFLLVGVTLVRVDRFQTSEELIAAIHKQSSQSAPAVANFAFSRPSLVFYHQAPIPKLESTDQVAQFFQEHDADAFLITTDEQVQRLRQVLPSEIQIIEKDRLFGRKCDMVVLGRRSPLQAQAPRLVPQR